MDAVKYLAVIPARGGSKRIPRKNLVMLGGKPLMVYTIEAALGARKLSEVIVSTDDKEIAECAERWGVRVPYLRPVELAGDNSLIIDTLRYEVGKREKDGVKVEVVVLMQPNAPFLTSKDVDESIELFEEEGADTVTAVRKAREHPYYAWKLEGGLLKPFYSREKQMASRNEIPEAWVENGAIYVFRRGLLDDGQIYGRKVVPYEMDWESSVDIDEPEDLVWAEWLLSKGINK